MNRCNASHEGHVELPSIECFRERCAERSQQPHFTRSQSSCLLLYSRRSSRHPRHLLLSNLGFDIDLASNITDRIKGPPQPPTPRLPSHSTMARRTGSRSDVGQNEESRNALSSVRRDPRLALALLILRDEEPVISGHELEQEALVLLLTAHLLTQILVDMAVRLNRIRQILQEIRTKLDSFNPMLKRTSKNTASGSTGSDGRTMSTCKLASGLCLQP
ncbi:hypothetical protein N7539_004824 [Penicillium diatomitis]|uniref:Uncharacterized protein n=1 Tax=Penicillium diatomitis TaxID=2819901 RepID=A0A9W9X681_9EURO|nr:uncharacterized protein N7539_004824 [Penicillium diatomitis]KAJ5484836.1 hypothetical protein N7539_004824 [Penicillium diatomitis]